MLLQSKRRLNVIIKSYEDDDEFKDKEEGMIDNKDDKKEKPKNNEPYPNFRQVTPDGTYYEDVRDKDGNRFIIPMLSNEDPDYITKYKNYMFMKYHKEELYEKIINWD